MSTTAYMFLLGFSLGSLGMIFWSHHYLRIMQKRSAEALEDLANHAKKALVDLAADFYEMMRKK